MKRIFLMTLAAVALVSCDGEKKESPLLAGKKGRDLNRQTNREVAEAEARLVEACHTAVGSYDHAVVMEGYATMAVKKAELRLKQETTAGKAQLLAIQYGEAKDALALVKPATKEAAKKLDSAITALSRIKGMKQKIVDFQCIASDIEYRQQGLDFAAASICRWIERFERESPEAQEKWESLARSKDYTEGQWRRALDGLKPDLSD